MIHKGPLSSKLNMKLGAGITFGPELHVDANAASIGNEADATTGWTNDGFITFASTNIDPYQGAYHLRFVANSANDRASWHKTVEIGMRYKFSLFIKKIMPTDDFRVQIGSGIGFENYYGAKHGYVVYTEVTGYFFPIGVNFYITIKESGGNDNCEVYVDSVSLKKVIF